MAKMIFDKRGNKIIAMIVAIMPPQFERTSMFFAGGFEQVRVQLLLEKLICQALIDQDFVLWCNVKLSNDFCRIVFTPGRLATTEACRNLDLVA